MADYLSCHPHRYVKLDPPAVGHTRDQMHIVVRPATTIRNRYIVGLCHGGNLQAFGVTSDIDNVGLKNIHRLMDQQLPMAPFVSLVLTGRNRDLSLPPEIGKEPRVVSIDRL